jgi:cell division protein FtsB
MSKKQEKERGNSWMRFTPLIAFAVVVLVGLLAFMGGETDSQGIAWC